jgi:hypothetical protein
MRAKSLRRTNFFRDHSDMAYYGEERARPMLLKMAGVAGDLRAFREVLSGLSELARMDPAEPTQ